MTEGRKGREAQGDRRSAGVLGAAPVTEDQGGTLETHEEVSEVKPDEIIGRRFLKHIGIPSQLERS